MQYHEGILYLFTRLLLPCYLFWTVVDKDFVWLPLVLAMIVFGYFTGIPLKEPTYLLKAKIQAYKELLREVPEYLHKSRYKTLINESEAIRKADFKNKAKKELFRNGLGIRLKKPKP